LIKAVEQFNIQLQSWIDFTEKQRDQAPEWKKMVEDYESNLSDFNPYALPISGKIFCMSFTKVIFKSYT
jgi:hypothetical protein